MVDKIHGTSSSFESISKGLEFYQVFASSNGAFLDPDNAMGVNILVTNNVNSLSQQNFDTLARCVSFRALPIIMGNPKPVLDLSESGAPSLGGEGFVWRFSTEQSNIFENFGPRGTIGPVGFLIDELNNIPLPSGVRLITLGIGKNIEFMRTAFV
jgi:hypothetical protein